MRRAIVAALALGIAPAAAQDAAKWGVIFSTTELSATTRHAGIGAKLSLTGDIDRAGALVMLTAGTHGAAIMGGWQAKFGETLLVGLAGPEASIGGRVGARLHGELWAHPAPSTTAALVVSCGTAERHCWSRMRVGLPVFGLSLGPEVVVANDRAGLGIAVTGARILGMDVEIAAGVARSRRDEVGPYGTMALVRRF